VAVGSTILSMARGRHRATAIVFALAIAAVALATAACERAQPVVSPTAMWHRFADDAHGFALDIQEPYRPTVEGARAAAWHAGVARPDDTGGAPRMTITVERLPRGSTLASDTLIDFAPTMTKEALESRRRAGATDLRLEQPLQPLDVSRFHALEMVYTWTDAETKLAMRSDVVAVVNDRWLITFEITGPAVTWDEGGPTLRRFVDTLRLYEPGKS
jgi:hypothetical protein